MMLLIHFYPTQPILLKKNKIEEVKECFFPGIEIIWDNLYLGGMEWLIKGKHSRYCSVSELYNAPLQYRKFIERVIRGTGQKP